MTWRCFEDEVMRRFNDLQTLVQSVLINQQTILTKETTMSAELDALTTAVTEIKGQVDSTITLVTGLSDYIRAHADDPAAMTALADDLNAKKAELAAAVDANPVPPG